MRRDSADYSLMPPDLTDSEYDYDSETDTEDSMPAEHHPSGSSSAASTSSVSSCKNHLPEKLIESRTIIRNKPVTDVEINSSNNARKRLRMHKDLSKDAFRDKVQPNFHHPPGTYSSVKRTKQCVDTCEGTGKNMLREEGSSAPNTTIGSSPTEITSPKVDWSPNININSKCFHPSGIGLSRANTSNNIAQHEDAMLAPPRQAVEKVKSNIEVVNKDHRRKTKGNYKTNLYRKEVVENLRMILPDLVESDEESDSESEAEQEYIMDATRDIYDATRDTYDFLEGEKQNDLQPSGRTRSCMGMTKAEYIDNEYIHNYDEAPNKISGKHHEEGTKENCTADLYEKRAVEIS